MLELDLSHKRKKYITMPIYNFLKDEMLLTAFAVFMKDKPFDGHARCILTISN